MSNRKKSFTGQLFDFILDDNNFNKKNLITLILIVGIIGVVGAISLLNLNYNQDDLGGYDFYGVEYNANILEEFGYSKAEIEEMDEETIKSLGNTIMLRTKNQIAGEPYKGEYPYNKSIETRNKFYQYALNGDFESIINEYQKIKSSNYLSEPYNQKLIRIYNDAYVINATLNDKYNTPMQIDTLSKINDERMMLSILLSSNLEVRNSIIKDRMSLTLGKEDKILKINSVSSSTMSYNARNFLYEQDVKMEKMINHIGDGDYILYKINFNLDDEVFNAYMYKNSYDMVISVYGIYPDEHYNKSTNYITVAESAEILSNMEGYNNSMNDNYSYNYNNNNDYIYESNNDYLKENTEINNIEENSEITEEDNDSNNNDTIGESSENMENIENIENE